MEPSKLLREGNWTGSGETVPSLPPHVFEPAPPPDFLQGIQATFWSRGRKTPIGRLDEPGTRAAFTVPCQAHDVTVEEDALALLLEQSQHYPYLHPVPGRTAVGGAPRVPGQGNP